MARRGVVDADRRAATRRRLHETENLLARLDAALASRETEAGDELLRQAARSLAALVARTPGADLVVSVGPGHSSAVRLRLDPGGELCVDLVRDGDDPAEPVTEVIPSPRHTASALASLLWTGGLSVGNPPSGTDPTQEA